MNSTQYRYEFGIEEQEQIDHFTALHTALERALHESHRHPATRYYIFDRMAHKGANELYTITGGLIVEITRRQP